MHRVRASRKVLWCLVALFCAGIGAASAQSAGAESSEGSRERFLKLIDRPRVEPASEVSEKTENNGVVTFHFAFSSEADQRVPAIAVLKQSLIDDGRRHPCAIVLHGTGGKKEGELGILKKLAAKDFIAVSIDGRFHGERGAPADYNAAIAKAFADGGTLGHPLYYDTVWDVLRLVDLLQTRPEIDPDRIGLMGISKGGIETWLAAAADPRIAVAIPCISLQSFEWSLQHDGWQNRVGTFKGAFNSAAQSAGVEKPDAVFARHFYDRVIPGIYSTFDGPVMLPLIAPRPLLAISGENDPINPLPGARICEEAAKAAYAKAGAGDKFELIVEAKTGHAVNAKAEEAAIDWFVKYLDPATAK